MKQDPKKTREQIGKMRQRNKHEYTISLDPEHCIVQVPSLQSNKLGFLCTPSIKQLAAFLMNYIFFLKYYL